MPPNGPLIVVANHLSTVDPPLLGSTFPRKITFMAKDELFSFPSGLLIRALGAFSANKLGKSGLALRHALRVIENGGVLGIFPEGKRSNTYQMARGEIGVAFLALRSGAPIITVGISGSEHFEHNTFCFRRPKVSITIGEPFSLTHVKGKLTRDELRKVTDDIMRRNALILPRKYRGIYADDDKQGVGYGNQIG